MAEGPNSIMHGIKTQVTELDERTSAYPSGGVRSRRPLAGWLAAAAMLASSSAHAGFLVNYDIPNKTGQTADALSVVMNANNGTAPFAFNTYNGGSYWPNGESKPAVPGAVFSLFSSLDTTAGAVFGGASTTQVAEFRWDFAVPGVASAADGSKGVHIGAHVLGSNDCNQFAQRIFFRNTSGQIILPHVTPVDPSLCFVVGFAAASVGTSVPSLLAPGQTASVLLPIQVTAGEWVVSRVISSTAAGDFSMSAFRQTDQVPVGTTGVTLIVTNPLPPDGSPGVPMRIHTLAVGTFATPFALEALNPENQALVQHLVPIVSTPAAVPVLGGHLGRSWLSVGLIALGAIFVGRQRRRQVTEGRSAPSLL